MKSVASIFLALVSVSLSFQVASATEERTIMTLAPAIIAAAAQCPHSEAGTWISTNRKPIENEFFISFDGNGNVSELGAFSYGTPAGTYNLYSDCSITGIVTTSKMPAESTSFTGQLISDSSMNLIGNSMNIDLIKVSDPAACQGTWSGTLVHINPPQPPSPTIQFQVGADGTISSFTGLASPVSGKMYCESGRGVAHIKTGEVSDLNELSLDGTLSGNTMTGEYVIDNSNQNDPDGTFSISRQ